MARPRDSRIDARLIDAWQELVAEHGYDDVTMESVAARAGVGKPALYRRFRSKAHLAFAVSVTRSAPQEVPDLGDVRSDLLACIGTLATEVARVPRQALADQVAAVVADPGFAAEVADYHAAADRIVLAVLERAVARGEIDPAFDLRLAVLDLGGALIFHATIRHGVTDRAYQEQLVDRLLHGLLRRPA